MRRHLIFIHEKKAFCLNYSETGMYDACLFRKLTEVFEGRKGEKDEKRNQKLGNNFFDDGMLPVPVSGCGDGQDRGGFSEST